MVSCATVRDVGRPSLAAQRTAEILDAYARCAGRFGLDGATLERVAAESGFSRGHIRHYLGNRDEMRTALIKRTISGYVEQGREILSEEPKGRRSAALVDYVLGPAFAPSWDNATIDALWGAAVYDDRLREELRNAYLEFEKTILGVLKDDFPGAPAAVYRDAAYQLLALSFGHWSISALEFPANRERSARKLATAVIDGVQTAALR
jgi:AcrR family transcriptional regulator